MNPDLPATTTIVNYSTETRVAWLIWEAVSLIGAGYVAARIAASSRITHATAMGLIQAVVTSSAMMSSAKR
jgi:N-methylhydantoinase B/oxoprolinase/acetone carboxylase alpha subunit